MRVFISSVMTGYERFRDAVVSSVRSLGGEIVRAEDFGASSATPQQVCLAGVRSADVVVLLIGSRYGAVQTSDCSATEEEYLEARESKPVLVFVETVADREARQESFLTDVRSWARGHLTEGFTDPESLRMAVTRQLHRLELSQQAGAADSAEMLARALRLVADDNQSVHKAEFVLAVAGGPRQSILRPAAIESDDLYNSLLREACFGPNRVLDTRLGTERLIRDDTLLLQQQVGSVLVNEEGSVRIVAPARESKSDGMGLGLAVLIQEDIEQQLVRSISYAGWVLNHIDPTNRVTQVALVTALRGGDYLGWRTRAEQARSPNSVQIKLSVRNQPVNLTPPGRPREALLQSAGDLAEDLTIRLRRQRS